MAQGIEKIPLRIPEKWDAAWYLRHIREVLALADTRNAFEGPGISITGTSDVPATISASADILNLLQQAYVLAAPSSFLPNERILDSSDGLTITDGGPNAPITVGIGANAIPFDRLSQGTAFSVIGRPQATDGTLVNITADLNDTLLRRTGDLVTFGQITLPMAPDALWTYAKIQNVSATSRVLGRISSGAGVVEELTGANIATILGSLLPSGANPTGTIGLTAVNGSATTFLRSDGAPPIDQGISPTWTGTHRFSGDFTAGVSTLQGVQNGAAFGGFVAGSLFGVAAASANNRVWYTRMYSGDDTYAIEALNDTASAAAPALSFTRSGVAVISARYNNPTDNGTHTFYTADSGGYGGFRIFAPSGSTSFMELHGGGATLGAGVLFGQDSNGHAFLANRNGSGDIYITNAAGFAISISTARLVRFNAYGAGALTTDASGNITAVSDERAKRRIRSFSRGLEAILPLHPILYGYTLESGLDQSRDDYAGFSAQNVRESIPEAVAGTERLTLSDRPILAALVNAMRQVNDRLNTLETAT